MEKLVNSKNGRLVNIKNRSIVALIIRSYANEEKRKFLDKAVNRPRTILEIIDACKLPQTSSYRKINSLIKGGLLISVDQISAKYGKKVKKYVTLFENLEIKIIKNEINIKAKLNEDACQAIFRMMREKIISVHQKQKMLESKNYQVIQKKVMSVSNDTMIPYLLKEDLIKV